MILPFEVQEVSRDRFGPGVLLTFSDGGQTIKGNGSPRVFYVSDPPLRPISPYPCVGILLQSSVVFSYRLGQANKRVTR